MALYKFCIIIIIIIIIIIFKLQFFSLHFCFLSFKREQLSAPTSHFLHFQNVHARYGLLS